MTNIPELWWCKQVTCSIAEEGKISLPSFYSCQPDPENFHWSAECRVIRKNSSPGTGNALSIISITITSCLCKFWFCIIQDRWNSTHFFYEHFDEYIWNQNSSVITWEWQIFPLRFYFAQKHYMQLFVRIFLWPELFTNFSLFSLLVMLSRWKC